MPIPMEALGYQNYDGRWYVRGETIPVKNEEEAADMVALRLAKRRPVLHVAEEPRNMAPEDEAQPLPEKGAVDAKRTVPTLKRGKYLTRGSASAPR